MSCARFVSPATGARWQSQVSGGECVSCRLLGQQHKRNDGAADHGARQGNTHDHVADIEVEHLARHFRIDRAEWLELQCEVVIICVLLVFDRQKFPGAVGVEDAHDLAVCLVLERAWIH